MRKSTWVLALAFIILPVFQSCQDKVEREGAKEVLKTKTKKKRRHKDHIDVDMVARTLRFVKKNVEITAEQESRISDITSEYKFDSLSREEFYFRRLKLRDRIYNEVLTEPQRRQLRKK